jgi:hypothetical protein
MVGQEREKGSPPQPGVIANAPDKDVDGNTAPEQKRIFGIIPNYRSASIPVPYKPLSTREKFKIACQDSFDRGTVLLAALFAGEGQLTNSNPEFGEGAAGYGRYFGTSYGDFVIGDFMTEAIFPSLLHQDPRFFPRHTGNTVSRLGYAAYQIFWTHKDSGQGALNVSELAGNAAAVAISNSYYPGSRNATDNVTKFATQIGVDMAANMIKEFSADIHRKIFRKH